MSFRRLAAAVLATALWVQPLTAQTTVEDQLGPLAPFAANGLAAPWTSGPEGPWFTMSNGDDPNSIAYLYGADIAPAAQDYHVSLNVYVQSIGNAQALAGLVLNQRGAEDYTAVAVGSDGLPMMAVRSAAGFSLSEVGGGVRARLDGTDILEMTVRDGAAAVLLNGAELTTVRDPRGLSRSLGIFAGSTGKMYFTNLRVTPLGAAPVGPGPSPLPDLSPAELQVRMGVTLGIFLHEFAHAVIGETGLPAPGPEEDVADSFSAFTMASILRESPPEYLEANRGVVAASSLLWYNLARQNTEAQRQAPWQGEHSPDIKRFRFTFCVLYGADPEGFAAIADKVEFGDAAKARCAYDFERKFAAWEELLTLRGRNLGPDMPGTFPADAPGGELHLTFQPAASTFGKEMEAMLQQQGLISGIVDLMERYFVWPRDVTITFRDCEEVNAWYDPQAGSVTMCYSVVREFSKFGLDTLGGG
ncbi:hypothetical protein DXV76_13470 [Rhodobacteraceae bacterium CCMM004]|nr:hypothetical protein DXV76_13470 [Rhodobacteraceae bacterium CCMM004]